MRAAQSLERGRWRQIHGSACRPPGPSQRGGKAQQTEDQRRHRAPVKGRLHAGKESAAQIAAQHLQRQPDQPRTQRDAGQAAQSPQRQRFQQHQCHALAWRGPKHGQQRKLRRALGHAERQHGEHQKRSREQGHQRQHREVDAVGARHLAHALLIVAGLLDQYLVLPGRQGVQGGGHLAAAGAVGQQKVQPVDTVKQAELLLQCANVHDCDRCAAGGYRARNAKLLGLAVEQPLHGGVGGLFRTQSQGLQGGGIEKHGVGCKQIETVTALKQTRHQCRGDRG